jgi:two-component system cell cycle sensor histidine kinase/response regulator CckA
VFSDNADEIRLVLMDLGMPGMDGTKAFRRLREIHPGVQGLLLTGLPQSDEAQEALREGFAAVVQKPFRIEDLSQKIREALETT